MKKKRLKKSERKKKIQEKKNTVSLWHDLDDKDYDRYMDELELFHYDSKHILDEETWTDFLSFQQEDY